MKRTFLSTVVMCQIIVFFVVASGCATATFERAATARHIRIDKWGQSFAPTRVLAGSQRTEVQGLSGGAIDVRFESGLIAVADRDSVKILELASGKLRTQLPKMSEAEGLSDLSFAGSEIDVAIAYYKPLLVDQIGPRVVMMRNGAPTTLFRSATESVFSIASSRDGKYIVYVHGNGLRFYLTMYRLTDGLHATVEASGGLGGGIAFMDQYHVAAAGDLWDFRGFPKIRHVIRGDLRAFSPDGKTGYAVELGKEEGIDGEVRSHAPWIHVIDTTTWKTRETWELNYPNYHGLYITELVASPDGRLLLVGQNHGMFCFSVEHRTHLFTLEAIGPRNIKMAPDSSLVITGGRGLAVWNLNDIRDVSR